MPTPISSLPCVLAYPRIDAALCLPIVRAHPQCVLLRSPSAIPHLIMDHSPVTMSCPPPRYRLTAEASDYQAGEINVPLIAYHSIISNILARARPSVSVTGTAEAIRVRNFLLFTLIEDYGCNDSSTTKLSAEDVEHFATLASILRLIERADAIAKPCEEEVGETHQYLQQCIFEPCALLGLPTECVWMAIMRWIKYPRNNGPERQDCRMRIIFKDDPEKLARKFFTDRTIVIPMVVTSSELLEELLGMLQTWTNLFFYNIQKIEVPNLPLDGNYTTRVNYVLSGLGHEAHMFDWKTRSSSCRLISPRHWVARFKQYTTKRRRTSRICRECYNPIKMAI